MKITKFEDRESWMSARRGKITGSRLKDIIVKRGVGHKLGYYELIAERLAIEPEGDETAMDRGTRLESEAMQYFMDETGQSVDTSLVIWSRDDNESIAISPDGFVGDSVAVEVKCLSSAKHLEAFLTRGDSVEVPVEYKEQVVQYFIVNDNLQTLYFVFYDPRIPCKPFFYHMVNREDIKEDIALYLQFQRDTLAEVNSIVAELSGF